MEIVTGHFTGRIAGHVTGRTTGHASKIKGHVFPQLAHCFWGIKGHAWQKVRVMFGRFWGVRGRDLFGEVSGLKACEGRVSRVGVQYVLLSVLPKTKHMYNFCLGYQGVFAWIFSCCKICMCVELSVLHV